MSTDQSRDTAQTENKSATSKATCQKTTPSGITLDRKLVAKARKAARRRGSSFSAYVEDAILENLARVTKNAS